MKRGRDWEAQIAGCTVGHWYMQCSMGNRANNVVTVMNAVGWALGVSGPSLCKLQGCLITQLHTRNSDNIVGQL